MLFGICSFFLERLILLLMYSPECPSKMNWHDYYPDFFNGGMFHHGCVVILHL